MKNPGFFQQFIERQRKQGRLIAQPRMGFSGFDLMRNGLKKVKDLPGPTIGTITLDSYTRTGEFEKASHALLNGLTLNGYPIIAYGTKKNRELIHGILSPEFPIQVRHGSPLPFEIFQTIIDSGIDATEGGPISYCLPYGRIPLTKSIKSWNKSCELFAGFQNNAHIESFGGCLLGQLCPPALLVTIVVLEGIFFQQHNINSISLSYAQGYNMEQDAGALKALRRLADLYLDKAKWHVVIYTFMGMFPENRTGARRLIEDSIKLALLTESERIIIKTISEAHHIPSIKDNIESLKMALGAHPNPEKGSHSQIEFHYETIYEQAKFLLDLTLNLSSSIDRSISLAFQKGYLDIPYCIHPDNKNIVRSNIHRNGIIEWAETGGIPFPDSISRLIVQNKKLTSSEFLKLLLFNKVKYEKIIPFGMIA